MAMTRIGEQVPVLQLGAPPWLLREEPVGHDRRFVIGAAIGAGMIAEAAERGGADFLVALNAGRIRVMGAPSVACMLAIHDANEFVFSFARSEILAKVSVPVVFGASAMDPRLDLDGLVARVRDAGFAGIANFPPTVHLDERLREALAEHGLGYQREVALLGKAREAGLGTVAYVRRPREALAMAEAGVDIICHNFGWNAGGVGGLPSPVSLADAADETRRVFDLVRKRREDVLCVVEGGPIETPDDAAEVCRAARADGYIGGSTIDRLPLETAVREATSGYKSVAVLSHRIEAIQDELLGDGRRFGLIGRSPGIRQAVRLINRFADTDLTVLILGPNGTGKELVAQALHEHSLRCEQPLIAVNCAAIPHDLLESELFGFEKGAFTGASRARIGRFEEANNGTLFLDEIGDLDPALQAKLLRVLEGGSFERLGSNEPRRTNVRIICATNRDLTAMVAEGRFREDLYYRLNQVEITLPSLAERMEDLPLLADHLLKTALRTSCPRVRGIDGAALRALMAHEWPGNVRELKNVLERGAVLCDGEHIGLDHLPRFDDQPGLATSDDGAVAAASSQAASEREWILEGLRRNRFRRGATARYLGVSRKTLYNKMRRLDID